MARRKTEVREEENEDVVPHPADVPTLEGLQPETFEDGVPVFPQNGRSVDTEGTVSTPKLSPAEAREQKIMAVLGSKTGWEFQAYVELNPMGTDSLLNTRLKNGVRLRHTETGQEIITGRGVAEKYTDAEMPKKSKANSEVARGDGRPAAVAAAAEDTFEDVRETSADDVADVEDDEEATVAGNVALDDLGYDD